MTDEQRATLERWVRAGTTPQRLVFRSQIVLLAASGMPSKHVAHQLDTSQDTVRLWRRRFAAGGPDTLRRDAPGRGRKRQITAAREQQVVEATLHRAPPRATQWSLRSMAAAQGLSPGRCCTNRHWPARGQPTGSSPADAIRHWSAEGGHPIEDLTAEDDLAPLPGWAPGAKTISDDGLVSEECVLHPALTMVP